MIRAMLPQETHIIFDRVGAMDPWRRLDIPGEALAQALKDDEKRKVLVWEESGRVLGVVVYRRGDFAESVCFRGFGVPLAAHFGLKWPCAWQSIPDGGYVHVLAVFENGHGKGVGSQLLRAAENDVFRGGIKKMYLMVSDFNKAAQGFYAMQGYRRIATVEDCIREGNTEHLMEKRLRDATATW